MSNDKLQELARSAYAVDEAVEVLQRWVDDPAGDAPVYLLDHLKEVREEILMNAPPALAGAWRVHDRRVQRIVDGIDDGDIEVVRDQREALFAAIYADAWSGDVGPTEVRLNRGVDLAMPVVVVRDDEGAEFSLSVRWFVNYVNEAPAIYEAPVTPGDLDAMLEASEYNAVEWLVNMHTATSAIGQGLTRSQSERVFGEEVRLRAMELIDPGNELDIPEALELSDEVALFIHTRAGDAESWRSSVALGDEFVVQWAERQLAEMTPREGPTVDAGTERFVQAVLQICDRDRKWDAKLVERVSDAARDYVRRNGIARLDSTSDSSEWEAESVVAEAREFVQRYSRSEYVLADYAAMTEPTPAVDHEL
jgi:hypothetical protein